jgi:hypothetical protein
MAQRGLIITSNLSGSRGINAAIAAVRILQIFCKDSTFKGILAADKKAYDFVPLLNTFDPVVCICIYVYMHTYLYIYEYLYR